MDAVLAQFRALSLEVHRPLHLTASVIMDEERIRDIVASLMQDPAVRGQIDTQCESIQHALTDNLLPAMRSAGLVGGKKERVKPRVLSAMQTEQCLTNIARSCVPRGRHERGSARCAGSKHRHITALFSTSIGGLHRRSRRCILRKCHGHASHPEGAHRRCLSPSRCADRGSEEIGDRSMPGLQTRHLCRSQIDIEKSNPVHHV